jgi:hypothetical protein
LDGHPAQDGPLSGGGPVPGDDGTAGFDLDNRDLDHRPSPEDDFDLDEHFAWLVRELDAGRVQPPPEPALDDPAISLSLGDQVGGRAADEGAGGLATEETRPGDGVEAQRLFPADRVLRAKDAGRGGARGHAADRAQRALR